MDLIYVGITAVLLLFTWGLMKICEMPTERPVTSVVEDKKSGGQS